jgi:DNA-binding NarL/FixJ family response regulator
MMIVQPIEKNEDMNMNGKQVRVLIVEDQSTFRHALEQALSQDQDIEVVDSFDTSQYTVARVGWRPVDVIIADLTWQGDPHRGLQLIQYTLDLSPQIKVIVYSAYVDEKVVRQTILAGVDGYLIKDEIDFSEIVRAIKSVQRNVPAYSNSIVKVMVRLLREGANGMGHTEVLDRLTHREREVAALLARGFSNTQVAQRLGIAVQTVKAHVSHVLRKLELSSRQQLKDYM